MPPLKFLTSLSLLALFLPTAEVRGAFIVNGDFENVSGTEPTFPGWVEANPGTASPAVTAISGSSSLLMNVATPNSSISQVLSSALTAPFAVSLDFAVTDANNTSTRSLNFFLIGSDNASQINLRVIEATTVGTKGDIQVYDQAITNWRTILTNVVDYSGSLSTPVTNSLLISGIFSSGTSNYTVTVNGSPTASLNYFQGARPVNFNSISLSTNNGTTLPYVVDNIVVTPEPSRALLMTLAFMGLISHCRGRCAQAQAQA